MLKPVLLATLLLERFGVSATTATISGIWCLIPGCSSKYDLIVEFNDISMVVQLSSKCFVYNCSHVCDMYPG